MGRGGADTVSPAGATPRQLANLQDKLEARARAGSRSSKEGAAVLEKVWEEFDALYEQCMLRAEQINDIGASAMAKTTIRQRFQDHAHVIKTFRPDTVEDDYVQRVLAPKCDGWLGVGTVAKQ